MLGDADATINRVDQPPAHADGLGIRSRAPFAVVIVNFQRYDLLRDCLGALVLGVSGPR